VFPVQQAATDIDAGMRDQASKKSTTGALGATNKI